MYRRRDLNSSTGGAGILQWPRPAAKLSAPLSFRIEAAGPTRPDPARAYFCLLPFHFRLFICRPRRCVALPRRLAPPRLDQRPVD